MSYRTVLVHVDASRHAHTRIRLAAVIAAQQEAHLVGAATSGVSRYVYQAGMIDEAAPNAAQHLVLHLDALRGRARSALQEFESQARGMEVRSFESALIDDEAGAGICLRARYSDLVVIGQFDPDEHSPVVMPDFPEFVVLNSGRPVLIVPHAGRLDVPGRRIVVAWDASISATRALVNALPMLKRAQAVDVAVFNPDAGGTSHGEQPGADIALYLARHGVRVNVIPQWAETDIGEALLSLAADIGADLLVMGGYGHSRFRELLLGGVTRTVLQSMTIPVLMSG
ncbi:MAG TPA: universal stress protein [Noviherbaspirillum sp.]|uniref:universal stress protein n=1 Tax=Noviherbaspirillum sp. TaxID=1926288 RepID=UPI002B4A88AA|nr:universal stress protein [Noviherbaspirillum sp.]HJV87734.1 universal stress protein [Noviherbaspirillum sp.]